MDDDKIKPLRRARLKLAPGAATLGYKTEIIDHNAISKTKEMLMKGIFAKGECSRWIAPPKMMKSAIASSAANHLGAGLEWFGHKVKRPVGVIYFALERPGLTQRRLIAEQKQLGLSNLPIKLCRERIVLATPADVKKMIYTIDETSDELECDVEFCIYDTSAKLIAAHGGDEQQAKDNALVWSNLAEMRVKTEVHTMVIGHMGKNTSKGERGSNATLGDADIIVTITGDEIKTATITDANDMAEGDLFSFRGREFSFGQDEDGDEDIVYIVDHAREVKKPTEANAKLTKNQATVFTILHDAGPKGLSLTEWNDIARKAGIGDRRYADLTDIQSALKKKRLVREYNDRWYVNHSS
jgi:RecA-family ATPase